MEFLIREITSQEQPTTPSLGQCPGIAFKSLHQRWGNPQANSDPWRWVYLISHSSLWMYQPRRASFRWTCAQTNKPYCSSDVPGSFSQNQLTPTLSSVSASTFQQELPYVCLHPKLHPSHWHSHGWDIRLEKSIHLDITNCFV